MPPAPQEIITPVDKGVKSTPDPGYQAPDSPAHFVLRTTSANYQPAIVFYIRLIKAEITCGGAVLTFLR